MYNNIIFKILGYFVQASIIYLLLRYYPYANMSATSSALATLIIILVTIMAELLCMFYLKNIKIGESFESISNSCFTCPTQNNNTLENFTCTANTQNESGDANNLDGCELTCKVGPNKNIGKCVMTCNGQAQKIKVKPNTTCDINEPSTGAKSGIEASIVKPPARPEAYPPLINENRCWDWGSHKECYDDTYPYGGMHYDDNPFYNKLRSSNRDNNIRNTGAERGTKETPDTADEGQSTFQNLMENHQVHSETTTGYIGPYQGAGHKSEELRTTDNQRRIEGPLDDELPYSDFNHLPVAAGYKSYDYEYGLSYIPPEKWYPQPVRPPICVTDNRSPVCPMTSEKFADLKEFHSSRRITGPYQLNTDYVNDKMNSGR